MNEGWIKQQKSVKVLVVKATQNQDDIVKVIKNVRLFSLHHLNNCSEITKMCLHLNATVEKKLRRKKIEWARTHNITNEAK